MEYPRRILDVYPAAQQLFDSMYFHERKRLGLTIDLEVPSCKFCTQNQERKKAAQGDLSARQTSANESSK